MSLCDLRVCALMGKRSKRSLATFYRQPNNSSEQILSQASLEHEQEEIERAEQPSPCLLDAFPRRSRRRRVHHTNAVIMSRTKLDTGLFEQYSEKLWETFSESERVPFTRLDSLWFPLYLKRSSKLKVLSWIKKKCILSKKYIFVPLVRWDHWSLLILCHFGESFQSNATSTPCMLLLDSLHSTGPERLQPDIRKFIQDIYAVEGRPETKKQLNKIPLLIPKVPQQRDDMECGKFVIYYMKLFMEAAPENFSISDGYPYSMNQSWFSGEEPQRFLEQLESVTDGLPIGSPSATVHGSVATPYRPSAAAAANSPTEASAKWRPKRSIRKPAWYEDMVHIHEP